MKINFLRSAALAAAVAGTFAAAGAATLVQKNAYAYDIRVDASRKDSPVVTYKLNGLAGKVEIETYADGVKLPQTTAGTTNQSNSVTVSMPPSATGKITFRVVVTTKTTVTAPTLIQDAGTTSGYYRFYAPFGVTVNNCTDANTFGRVLVTENRNVAAKNYGTSAVTTYHSSTAASGRGAMIYAFDPQLQPIVNEQASNKYGFNAGLNVNTKEIVGEYHRVKYSADGRLFLSTSDPERYGLYELSPDNLNQAATPLLSVKGQQVWGFDVYGSGKDLKMVVNTNTSETANTTAAITTYTLGTAKTLTGGVVQKNMSGKSVGGTGALQWVNGRTINVAIDPDGNGLFVGQYRGTPTAAQVQYAHGAISESGAVDYTDITSVSNGAAVGYNKDYTIFARVEKNATVAIYKVTASNNGKAPSLTKVCDLAANIGNAINQVAFDYANNIYIVGNSGEKLISYQLPVSIAGASQSVPAPESQAYTIEASTVLTAGTAQWKDANTQQVSLSWTAVKGASAYNVYRNGALVMTVSETGTTADLPLASAADNKATVTPVFTVKPVIGGSEGSASNECVVYHAPFEANEAIAEIDTDPTTGVNNVNVSWTKPAFGNVIAYVVYRTTGTEAVDGTLVGQVDGSTYSIVDQNIRSGKYAYYVDVQMDAKVLTAAGKETSVVTSALSEAVQRTGWSKPEITQLEVYPGHNSVRIRWELPNSAGNAQYYEVYRDGIKVVDRADYYQSIDIKVPDGDHTYVVAAVFAGGQRVLSTPRSLEKAIARDEAVSQFGIEEVYNYPILSAAEAAAKGYDSSNAFITDRAGSPVANMHLADGAYGSRGGMYRTAKFKNGKWYISQLHDRTTVDGQTVSSPHVDYSAYTTAYGDETAHGGIIEIDERNLLTAMPVRIIENAPARNQVLASDDAPNGNLNFVLRSDDQGYFYGINSSLDVHHYNAAGDKWSKKTITGLETADLYDASTQVGRVHYASASGQLWGSTGGKIYYALNKLPIMYVFDVASGDIKSQTRYEAKSQYIAPDENGRISSTENYAFPIVGREDFIWELRSNGYYYVNAATQEVTRICNENVSRNAGGLTFVYQDQLFFIHPSAFHSNNTGHFLIDKPLTVSGEAHTSADFTKLVPMVSVTQSGTSTGEAANSNGQWYGAEYSEEEDCMYVYLYVPGVRFAKYRFYSYDNYPSVTPQLDVEVCHNEDGTDITNFEATIAWQRPAKYAFSGQYNDYEIRDYTVTLCNAELKEIKTWTVADEGYNVQNPSYSVTYDRNTLDVMHLDEQIYTAYVTPNYIPLADTDRVIVGETGSDQSSVSYDAGIEEISAICYESYDGNVFRVDIDVTPADKAEYPQPVSFFTIDYSTDGGQTFVNIPDMAMFMDGGKIYNAPGLSDNPDAPVHNYKLPGTYRFTGEEVVVRGADDVQMSDKGSIDKAPCVAFYYTGTRPDASTIYRATAHYADGNSYIAKQASTTNSVIYGGLTSVDDLVADGADAPASIYPVPATTAVTVTLTSGIETVRIFSTSGALVKMVQGDGNSSVNVNVSDLSAGNYVVVVNDGKPLRLIKK